MLADLAVVMVLAHSYKEIAGKELPVKREEGATVVDNTYSFRAASAPMG